MGLGGCYSVLKLFLVIFNFLFWILGIAGLVFGIWMLVDPTFSVSLTQDANDYMISIIIILIASILLVIVAGIGIYGTLRESQCALITFFSFLLIIVVAEVSAGLWAYINSDSLELQVRNAVRLTVEEEYGKIEGRKLLYDTFQKNLHCCGADKPSDWMGNKQVIVTVTSDPTLYNIPDSCCRDYITQTECDKATKNIKVGSALAYNIIYDKGCYTLIIDSLKENTTLIITIGIAIVHLQVLALIFALTLAFAVNRSNRYKA